MKKKIVALCLVVALAVVAIGGATLAYFTDTDSKANTFTTGKVDITLNDEFVQNSKLVPAVVDEDSNILNSVDKVVSVTNNTGSEEAYVRVHMAIPSSIRSLIGLWTFEGAKGWEGANDTRTDDPTYTVTIDNVEYVVFVYTYTEALAAGESTTNILEAVTMEPTATNEQVAAVNGKFDIKIVAEGCQTAGFDDAESALNEAFGDPATDTDYTSAITWPKNSVVVPSTPDAGDAE